MVIIGKNKNHALQSRRPVTLSSSLFASSVFSARVSVCTAGGHTAGCKSPCAAGT